MELQLSTAEQELLVRLLEQDLFELDREIAHTDQREFRALLKARREVLEHMLSRLAALAACA